jgi:hypothetical protein
MTEWSKVVDCKSIVKNKRGFESYSFQALLLINIFLFIFIFL